VDNVLYIGHVLSETSQTLYSKHRPSRVVVNSHNFTVLTSTSQKIT